MRPVEGTGETLPRGLSEHMEATAIEHELTEGYADLPEYNRVSMADQAEKAEAYINQDYEAAKDVAMGRKAPPKGVLPESILVAVEKRALAEGDPTSPIEAIQEVQKAREADIKARGESDVKAKVQSEAKELAKDNNKAVKAELKKIPAWQKFLSEIKCES